MKLQRPRCKVFKNAKAYELRKNSGVKQGTERTDMETSGMKYARDMRMKCFVKQFMKLHETSFAMQAMNRPYIGRQWPAGCAWCTQGPGAWVYCAGCP